MVIVNLLVLSSGTWGEWLQLSETQFSSETIIPIPLLSGCRKG